MTISQNNFDHQKTVSLAQALAEGRRSAGYSFDELAVASGLTVGELEALEKGLDRDPGRLRRVATALQLHQLAI